MGPHSSNGFGSGQREHCRSTKSSCASLAKSGWWWSSIENEVKGLNLPIKGFPQCWSSGSWYGREKSGRRIEGTVLGSALWSGGPMTFYRCRPKASSLKSFCCWRVKLFFGLHLIAYSHFSEGLQIFEVCSCHHCDIRTHAWCSDSQVQHLLASEGVHPQRI